MNEDLFIPRTECALHREVINTKLDACNTRVDGILAEIQTVRELQKNIYNTLIFIAIAVILTLGGVILGRGIEIFGWLGK